MFYDALLVDKRFNSVSGNYILLECLQIITDVQFNKLEKESDSCVELHVAEL